MASVGLEQIYEWTGIQIGFWVNILKDGGRNEHGKQEDRWEGMDLEAQRRAEVRREILDERISVGGSEDVFIVSFAGPHSCLCFWGKKIKTNA